MEQVQDVSDYLVNLRNYLSNFSSVENKGGSSDEVESFRDASSFLSCNNSMSSIKFSQGLSYFSLCNANDVVSRTADLIAEVHYNENKAIVNPIKDHVCSVYNEYIDFSFDCIYDLEPLGFEKHSVKDEDHFKGVESQDPLEEINLGSLDDVRITYICKDLKNRKLRVCIDFRDLNSATPKDEHFMPIADMLIDSAVGNEILSFMDGYLRYNQIFIAEDDRAMNGIFHEYIGRFMEVYIDDVMVKLISVNQHIDHLRKAFVTMRKKGLKMNALKCAFEVQSFLGKVNYLQRFISNLSDQTRVFAPLVKLKNDSQFEWTYEHQKAFDSIKAYLSKAPIMANVRPHEPLKLYIAASANIIGCMLAQNDENGHEWAIYYLSRVLTDIETRIHNEIAKELAQIASRYGIGPETLRKLASIHQILVPADEREALCIGEWEDNDWEKPIAEYLKNPSEWEDNDWKKPIAEYLKNSSVPVDRKVKLQAINFVLMADELYKKGIDGSLSRCLSHGDKDIALGEVHKGICGAHQAGKKIKWVLCRNHVYWPTMIKDCIKYAKACQKCQKHGSIQQIPASELHLIIKPWPFRASRNINIVTSTPYYAQANGQVEAANKILIIDDYWNTMFDELNELDSERVLALENMIRQKESVARNYNRRIKEKYFSIGELVLKVMLPMEKKSRFLGKWSILGKVLSK
nr:uncharacterized protein LOC112721775 [Arachis hypogaea]